MRLTSHKRRQTERWGPDRRHQGLHSVVSSARVLVDVLIIVFGLIALIPTLGPAHVLVYSSRSASFRGLTQQEYRFANPRPAPITGLSVDWSFSTPPDNGFIETVAPAAQLQRRPVAQGNGAIVYHLELVAPLPAASGFSILFLAIRPFSPPHMSITAQVSTVWQNGVHREEVPTLDQAQWDALLLNSPICLSLIVLGIIALVLGFHLFTVYIERKLLS